MSMPMARIWMAHTVAKQGQGGVCRSMPTRPRRHRGEVDAGAVWAAEWPLPVGEDQEPTVFAGGRSPRVVRDTRPNRQEGSSQSRYMSRRAVPRLWRVFDAAFIGGQRFGPHSDRGGPICKSLSRTCGFFYGEAHSVWSRLDRAALWRSGAGQGGWRAGGADPSHKID